MSMFDIDEARELLTRAGVFFDAEEGFPGMEQTLNMNDTWAWACADGERVPDEDLPRVAELFWRYGHGGLLYWVSERRGGARSEFKDNNRFIEFVSHEEALRAREPSSSKRAYMKMAYAIGEEPPA